MMNLLEMVSDETYKGWFVDLYVRCTNQVAIKMYEGLGYSVYRRVREYYGSLGLGRAGKDEEDAFGAFICLSCSNLPLIILLLRYEKTYVPRSGKTERQSKWKRLHCHRTRSIIEIFLAHHSFTLLASSSNPICSKHHIACKFQILLVQVDNSMDVIFLLC